MKDSLTTSNSGDFSQRYAGTYGWLHLEGKREFVYVADVDNRRCYFNKAGDVQYHANADTGVIFEFIPVDKGWFNTTDGKLYFLQRRPARQFKRGIAETNTGVFDDRMRQVKLTYKLLATIFEDGFDAWSHKTLARPGALSKHFAITDNNGTIMLYDAKIGQVVDGVVVLENNLFLQELQDTLKRKNMSAKVIVNE